MHEGSGEAPRSGWVASILSFLGALALFAAVHQYATYRAQLGVEFADEGLYVSAPMRYAMGDVPLRDEVVNPHRMFDVLLVPIFKVFPDVTLIQMRFAGIWFQLLTAFVLFLALRGLAPDLPIAAACAATAFVPHRILTPGYHAMGACFFVLAWALLWRSTSAARRGPGLVFGVMAGIAAFLGAFSYLPFLAVLAVPGVILLRGLVTRRGAPSTMRATASMLLTTGICIALTVAWIFAEGLHTDWWYDHRALSQTGIYASSVEEKFESSIVQLVPYALTVTVATALGCWGTMSALRRWAPEKDWPMAGIVMGLLGGGIFLLILYADSSSNSVVGNQPVVPRTRLTLMALGFHLALLFVQKPKTLTEEARKRRFAVRLFLSGSLVFAFLQALLSDHAHKIAWAILPLFVSGIVALYGRITELEASVQVRRAAATCLTLACILAGTGVYTANNRFVYQNVKPFMLTKDFTNPMLKGIRSSPTRVKGIEEVLEFLQAHTQPGDYLLAYDFLPLMYFLTRTRPSVNTVWLSQRSPVAVRKRSLEYMKEEGRIPNYCVRNRRKPNSADPKRDPVHAWVLQNFRNVLSVHGFEVYERVR